MISYDIASQLKNLWNKKNITLHEPIFFGNEKSYLADCIDSGFVSSVGKYVSEFEERIEAYTGINHAVAMVNGTSALHMALKVVGVESNDEVMLPALTFVATANAVTYCGAIPHFVDCDLETLGVNPGKLRAYLSGISQSSDGKSFFNKKTGRKLSALVVMHTFGHPSNMVELKNIADEYGMKLIEDCAESLGSYYQGLHTGSYGDVGIFSFNGNKVITTGGGGMLVSNSIELAQKAKHLSTTAKLPHQWDFYHDQVGYNYRMPNINAALGCAQMENLDKILELKMAIHHKYKQAFPDCEDYYLYEPTPNAKSNNWLELLILSDSSSRDLVLTHLNECGYHVRPPWRLINSLPPYRDCPAMNSLEGATKIVNSGINLPSSPNLIVI